MDQDRAIGGMAMIELFEQNERMQDRQSSKGNQLKWRTLVQSRLYGIRRDGRVYDLSFTDKIYIKTRRVCAI